MKNFVKYTSYNQIIREFDVYIMLVNNDYQIKLVKWLDGDKPPRLTLEKLAEIMQEGFNKINQRIDKLDDRLTQIVKANNLIDPTAK